MEKPDKDTKEESLDTAKPTRAQLASQLDVIAQKLDEGGYSADAEVVSSVTEALLTPENPS
jgi:hypothetical protein